ncbi:MAG TPA: two-component regulator propeller domain-containing protein, partial [Vicinamibacterales bacterium]|nr:two-component regulator propeller domain-containing protein [Vicinamibacterales bacterium]
MGRASRSLLAVTMLLCVFGRRVDALDQARTLTQYVHRIWQVQQGLPQASIYAIAQTTDGRLWLGTDKGLVTFDGVRFTTVSANRVGLSEMWVTALLADHDGGLWIGTDESGVVRLNHGVLTRYTRSDGLPSDTAQCLFEDHDGRVWVCTSAGLATWNGKSFVPFTAPVAHAIHTVTAACETPDRRLWIAHDGHQLDVWPSGSADASLLPVVARAGAFRTMRCARSGDVWIGTSSGLLDVAGDRARLVTTADGLADNGVLTLSESPDGALFVGTSNGFSRIRERETESFRPQDGLSQSAVFALYEDREGTLWVGTGHGLNQFLDGRATPYTTSEGLPSNDTGPVIQDRTGTTWIGTLGAGLSRFDGHHFHTLTTRDGLVSNMVLALAEDHGGDLWVGTNHGLNRIHAGIVKATLTAADGLPSSDIHTLKTDASGDLWIGTARGLAVYHDGIVDRPDGTRHAIAALGVDRDGTMYVASDSGLEIYSRRAGKHVRTVINGEPALHHVDALYVDADGVLWLGTAGDGLLSIDHGNVSRYTVRDGLFDDSIYAVLGDNRGRLWMACSKGIFSIERAQLRRFHRSVSPKLISTPYSPTDGLRTIECKPGIQPGAVETKDAQLWFSTTRGVLVLEAQGLERRFGSPPVAIDEITVNGEPAGPAGIGTLPPGRNNVAFRYTGLSYVVPARITFRYMLEGFDTTWIDAGTRREAFYTNLPPGRFRFRISACNNEGACREAASAIGFSVQPRYYQRAWFIPACLVCAALVVFAGYRLRIRRLRDQFALILAERNRIARELHDTLIQGFSGITMEMQALAARLPTNGARQTLEQIVTDAGASLRDARRSLSGLRSQSEGRFGEALAQMSRQLTETRGVRLKLNLAGWNQALPPDVEYNLLRIAQEAVSNAVQHSGTRSV